MRLDRRALLKSAAAIGAAGVVAIPARAGTSPDADAELVRLGAQLDRLIDEWRPIYARHCATGNRWRDEMTRVGMSPWDSSTAQRIAEETNFHDACDANDAILAKLDKTCEDIWSRPASGAAGLLAWGKATRFACLGSKVLADMDEVKRQAWSDLDYADDAVLRLLAEIERMATGRRPNTPHIIHAEADPLSALTVASPA